MRVLFDIGVSGPLAGFVFLLPAFSIGLALSKVIPGIAHQGDMRFGVPLLQWLLQSVIFPGARSADIYLHPVARAAWVGIFATSLVHSSGPRWIPREPGTFKKGES